MNIRGILLICHKIHNSNNKTKCYVYVGSSLVSKRVQQACARLQVSLYIRSGSNSMMAVKTKFPQLCIFFARHVAPNAHCLNIMSLNRTDSLFYVRVHRADSLSIDGEILTRDANSPYGIRLKGGEYSRKGELSRNCDKKAFGLLCIQTGACIGKKKL